MGGGGKGVNRVSRSRIESAAAKSRPTAPPRPASQKRLPPAERERLIAAAAVRFFAERGFEGRTRDLARRIGVTQPLLYRYFPSKEALIERVYREVFVNPWNPEWPAWLADRSVPLSQRFTRFYQDYGRLSLSYEWVRLFVFAGLKGLDLNARLLKTVRRRIFTRVIAELRHAYGLPGFDEVPLTEHEIELIWALHAAIFYIGTRRWIYGLAVPKDLDALIAAMVKSFLRGAPAAIAGMIAPQAKRRAGRAR